MKVGELIELLNSAPSDSDVVIAQYNDGWDDGDVAVIHGAILTDDGIKLCEKDCPAGFKSYCMSCGIGCRNIWLVKTQDGPKWIENYEMRGPTDTVNRFELADPFGLTHKFIPNDAPLPGLHETQEQG